MLSAIETVSRTVGTVNRPPSRPLNPLPVDEVSAVAGQSVILSLGGGASETLTYTTAGTFDNPLPAAPAKTAAGLTTSAVTSSSAADATAAELTAAALEAIGSAKIAEAVTAAANLENAIAPSAALASPAIATRAVPSPAGSAPTTTNSASSTGTASAAATAITAPTVATVAQTAMTNPGATVAPKFSIDSAAQAVSNVAENPAYAGMAASFYLNVAAYRSPLALVLPLPDRADTPKAINGVSAARPVDAERQEANQEQRNGGNRARGLRA